MALPILLQKLFQNGGAGDKLNTSILPAASTTAVGAARIASSAEATAGTDATKIMTPALTKQAIDKFAPVKTVNGVEPDESGNVQILANLDEVEVKQIVLDTFFPVGSIYTDVTGNVNPNTQFGGTWEKIQNAFLYASGSKTVGTTGGEETHKLTTSEMPSHSHGGSAASTGAHNHGISRIVSSSNRPGRYWGSNSDDASAYTIEFNSDGTHSHTLSINNTGGGSAHNNMPPYLVVNIWKRTA